MKCPFCGCEKTKIVDSRNQKGKKRRRRVCLSCKRRFSTMEVYIEEYELEETLWGLSK